MIKSERSKLGKRYRILGKAHELATRKDLESQGWIVCRWDKQVNLQTNQLENSKPKFNPYTKTLMMSQSGFPDFIIFKSVCVGEVLIRLVESKMTGKLDKIEKQKIKWLYDNLNISTLIASKGTNKGEITYG